MGNSPNFTPIGGKCIDGLILYEIYSYILHTLTLHWCSDGAIFGPVPIWPWACNMSGFDQAKVGLHGPDPFVICCQHSTDLSVISIVLTTVYGHFLYL